MHTLSADLPLRSPMSWTADPATAGFTRAQPFRPVAPNVATHNARDQKARRDSIYHFYKDMIGLRNRLPSIARGSYEGAFAQGLVAGWQRRLGAEHTLVLINYGTSSAEASVAVLPAGARLTALWPRYAPGAQVGPDGGVAVRLPPQSVRVMRVQR